MLYICDRLTPDLNKDDELINFIYFSSNITSRNEYSRYFTFFL